MVFFCQRNCYETKFTSTVISCKNSKMDIYIDGKKSEIKCYEVIFKDTVFFPEGGGQPYDKGTINNIEVLKVLRKGGDAIHYMREPLEEGCVASQNINWERRHDHMQQHTAQHLITAVADRDYQSPTRSWNLGENISYIELDTPKLNESQCQELEETVNEAIRNSTPVLIEEFDGNDSKLKEVRTRGLPEDVVGPVRVVTIKDLDSNMCCGTHVHNLADLQAVKILWTEKGKGNSTLLYFVAGERLLRYFGNCITREKELNLLLHSSPSDHARIVEKNKKQLKRSLKSLSDALRDLAVAEAFKFNQISPKPNIFFHYRKDGDMEYLGTVINSISDDNVLKILTTGEDAGPGILIIHGNQEHVNAVAKGVCEILDGKGGGKNRFTAKIQKPFKRKEMEEFVRNTLPQLM